MSTIDRQTAIDAICKACSMEEDYHKCDGYPETSTWCDELVALRALPPAEPEIIRCKDCRKHNVSSGYKKDCCALYEWRGMSYGHEHDYQYCSYAERREE